MKCKMDIILYLVTAAKIPINLGRILFNCGRELKLSSVNTQQSKILAQQTRPAARKVLSSIARICF